MLEDVLIEEIKSHKQEINLLVERTIEIAKEEFEMKELDKSFVRFIAKHIIFFKELLYFNKKKYHLKVVISDLYFYILAIITNEVRYVYLNQRSIIENYMRCILSVSVEQNHINNKLFDELKDKYSISDDEYSLIKSEYYTACEYIHGGEALSENLISFFNDLVNKERKLEDRYRYYDRIVKIIKTFDSVLIVSNPVYISDSFHKRKEVLKFLLGKDCVELLFKSL